MFPFLLPVYQRDIYLLALFFLPFSLCCLYHLDRVPDQDSGAGTWPWVYLPCAKGRSSPDLPYRQLHQKGVDRMCSCCHRKGKTAFHVTPWCLSTKLPVGINQSNWIQEIVYFNFAFQYNSVGITQRSYFSFKHSVFMCWISP